MSSTKKDNKFSSRLWVRVICCFLAFAMVAGIILGVIFSLI